MSTGRILSRICRESTDFCLPGDRHRANRKQCRARKAQDSRFSARARVGAPGCNPGLFSAGVRQPTCAGITSARANSAPLRLLSPGSGRQRSHPYSANRPQSGSTHHLSSHTAVNSTIQPSDDSEVESTTEFRVQSRIRSILVWQDGSTDGSLTGWATESSNHPQDGLQNDATTGLMNDPGIRWGSRSPTRTANGGSNVHPYRDSSSVTIENCFGYAVALREYVGLLAQLAASWSALYVCVALFCQVIAGASGSWRLWEDPFQPFGGPPK